MAEKQLKNRLIKELGEVLENYDSPKQGKLTYGLAINSNRIDEFVDAITKARIYTDDVMAYEQDRMNLAREHAQKDPSGKPIIMGEGKDAQFILPNIEAFNEAMEEVDEKHPGMREKKEEQDKEYEELLDREEMVRIYEVKGSKIPEDQLPPLKLLKLFLKCGIIVDDIEE